MKPITFVTTGVTEIDILVGGWPRGRVSMAYGLSGLGKTHLMVQAMAKASKDLKVLYCDVENAINLEHFKKLGANLDHVDYSSLYILEEVCQLIRDNVGQYDIIILDSVAMLVPLAEFSGESGEHFVGLKPRLLGQWLRQLEGALGASKTALVLINQVRRSMELYGEKFIYPGGMQLKFSSSLILHLNSTSKDRIIKDGKQIGHWVQVKVAKSKISNPQAETKFKILY